MSGVALTLGVATSLAASLLSGVLSSTSVGAVSDARRLATTPQSGAFSIWAVIYVLLSISALYAFTQTVDLMPSLLLASAEVLSGLWIPLFLANTKRSLVAAALVLVVAAACAVSAVALVGPLATAQPWRRLVSVHVSFALFAGWLLVAATLSVSIALRAVSDIETPRWSLLVLSAGAAVSAAATRNPVLAAPCAWALVWQPQFGTVELSGLVACLGGGTAAMLF